MEPRKWWQHVPLAIRSKLHFYNVPVDEKQEASSALRMLAVTAKPEDFVVFKREPPRSPTPRALSLHSHDRAPQH